MKGGILWNWSFCRGDMRESFSPPTGEKVPRYQKRGEEDESNPGKRKTSRRRGEKQEAARAGKNQILIS